MEVYVKTSKLNDQAFLEESKRKSLRQLFEEGYTSDITKHTSKEPKWNEAKKCYSLNFGGKGKIPSTKNMILVAENEPKSKSLLFCKAEDGSFHL
jgi:hypothetical protein